MHESKVAPCGKARASNGVQTCILCRWRGNRNPACVLAKVGVTHRSENRWKGGDVLVTCTVLPAPLRVVPDRQGTTVMESISSIRPTVAPRPEEEWPLI